MTTTTSNLPDSNGTALTIWHEGARRPPKGTRKKNLRTLAIGIAVSIAVAATIGAAAERRPFGATVKGESNAAPTSDPCLLAITESGTGMAVHMGKIAWAATETLNVCSNPEGADAQAQFVITAANGDAVFGSYVSVVLLDPAAGVLTFTGRWRVAGGTGRFQDAIGKGTLSGEGRLTASTHARLTANFAGTISY
jgi:hypothetical protein